MRLQLSERCDGCGLPWLSIQDAGAICGGVSAGELPPQSEDHGEDTTGIEPDPALEVDSATDIWPGCEWREREVYDMYGIRFRNHPDLRRILLWKDYPAHPLRKDYPLRGRGERETYKVVHRDEA